MTFPNMCIHILIVTLRMKKRFTYKSDQVPFSANCTAQLIVYACISDYLWKTPHVLLRCKIMIILITFPVSSQVTSKNANDQTRVETVAC